jgi:phosphoribosylformimino-5-aminoimidazole carboxamide ribonucleotide (ProFAR) isomerase
MLNRRSFLATLAVTLASISRAAGGRPPRIVLRSSWQTVNIGDIAHTPGVLHLLEPYCSGFLCTYVDKEGMMQGTDLDWFRRLRSATALELTAAGGITTMDDVKALLAMNVHAALGMAIYTGRLSLDDLASLPGST